MAVENFERDTVLVVLPTADDCIALQNILSGSSWKLRFIQTSRRLPLSQLISVDVVLTDARLPGGRGWKNILHDLQRVPKAPPLIVADRLADEFLWAEVLNLGGYDVLSKPFDEMEVSRSVTAACRFRRRAPLPQMSEKVRWHVA